VLIRQLLDAGASVRAADPEALGTARAVLGDSISYHHNAYEALKGVDALFIATEWSEFRNPDFQRMKDTMSNPVIFDGRNLYSPHTLGEYGFKYFRIGAPGTE
jgi:UDPglucose 6-dehydrogenase